MKGYFDARLSQDLTLSKGENYDIAYSYDAVGRIEKETVTGSINKVITYSYDANDNIIEESIAVNGKTITKTYGYDENNNIISVATTVA